jgi:galactokinase/mevalonate kinase-like predicted kinase
MIEVSAPIRIDISGGWPDSDPYRRDFGGAVLNAAISPRVYGVFDGFQKTDPREVPAHSGLGTSGALRSVELAISNLSLLKDKSDLIRRVHMLENEVIGHRAGFQDQAAAIFGGVNYWVFSQTDEIHRTPVPRDRALFLQEHIVLIYTGQSHVSANMHDLVFGRGIYARNIPKLHRMKDIAAEMVENIYNVERFGELISETWNLQRSLHFSIETQVMRMLQHRLRGKYLGARAIGAGGGGCMIFYGDKEKIMQAAVKAQRELRPRYPEMQIVQFAFDFEGIRLERSE